MARGAYYAAQKKAQRPRARANVCSVALRRAGERCGRHRIAQLMRTAGRRAKQKRRFRPRTTDSRHLCPIAPNHLAERTEPPARPGEV